MKMNFSKSQWIRIGIKAGFIQESRRKDHNGIPIGYGERYVLKKKHHGMDDPYFFGNGSLHAPEMVMDFKDALQISGGKLEDIAYDWTMDWLAIPVKTPSPEIVFKDLKKEDPAKAKTKSNIKVAAPIPGTQNRNPDENNFAVNLGGVRKSLGGVKSKINKELHALGNYFSEIPLLEVVSILKKYNVILLQEDGTLWSGFVTTQGECGSDQANMSGPMKFELAGKTEAGYVLSNNFLLMTACTMPSGKLEVIVYIS